MRGRCVFIKQSEKQQHQWVHIYILFTAPGAWHSLWCYCFAWVLLSCPFLSTTAFKEKKERKKRKKPLHKQEVEKEGVEIAGDPSWRRHSVANIKYDCHGKQRGVWQENSRTIGAAQSILSFVCNARSITVIAKNSLFTCWWRRRRRRRRRRQPRRTHKHGGGGKKKRTKKGNISLLSL